MPIKPNKKTTKDKKTKAVVEKKVEEAVEKAVEKTAPKFFEALFATFFVAIFYFLLNRFYDDIKLFNENFVDVLGIINFSLIFSIIVHATRVFIHGKFYKGLTNILINIVNLYVASKIWKVFPFDTSVIGNQNTWDKIFKTLIILGIIGTCIGTFAEFIRLVSKEKQPERK